MANLTYIGAAAHSPTENEIETNTNTSGVTYKPLVIPESYRLRMIKTGLNFGLKPLLHLPRFTSDWFNVTRSLNGVLAWLSPKDHEIIEIPINCPFNSERDNISNISDHNRASVQPSDNLRIFFYPVADVDPGQLAEDTSGNTTSLDPKQTEKHLLFFGGGGYLFGNNGQRTPQINQYTRQGFNVWVPDYSLLHKIEPDALSRRTLAEAITLFDHVVNYCNSRQGVIGVTGDSAGADIIIRLMQYKASIGEPVQFPINLVSPAYLEFVDDNLLNSDSSKECVLPAFQITELKKTLRHEPITHFLNEVEIKQTFQGTAKVRITVSEGELLQNCASKLHRHLLDEGVDSELVLYEGHIHSSELFAFGAPEFKARLAESVAWMHQHIGDASL